MNWTLECRSGMKCPIICLKYVSFDAKIDQSSILAVIARKSEQCVAKRALSIESASKLFIAQRRVSSSMWRGERYLWELFISTCKFLSPILTIQSCPLRASVACHDPSMKHTRDSCGTRGSAKINVDSWDDSSLLLARLQTSFSS